MLSSKLESVIKRVTNQEKKAILSWLDSLANIDLPVVKGRILITALRNKTWFGWAVYASCVIRTMGYSATLLYDPEEDEKTGRKNFGERIREIPDIEFCEVRSNYDSELDIEVEEHVFYDAIAYDLHIEREDVRRDIDQHSEAISNLKEKSRRHGLALQSVLNDRSFHVFWCYSGLISSTSTLLSYAKKVGLNTVCLEGWSFRKGHMIYNFNAPALEYNITGWMNYYDWNEESVSFIENYMGNAERKNSVDKKDGLENFHNVQLASVGDQFPERIKSFLTRYERSFLLPPNVIGDSSTLNRETIFDGLQSWIAEIIEYFKQNPDQSLIIRAHPAEQWVKAKVKIQLGAYAKNLAKDCDNILVIESHEKVNSFSLVPFVKCGLVWISSIGADLAARGIPVVCAARPKYENLGFVKEPDSVESYYHQIEMAFEEKNLVPLTESQIEMAKRYLFITFKGFSFPGQDADYHPTNNRIGRMPDQKEHDRFFNIITTDIEAPDSNHAALLN